MVCKICKYFVADKSPNGILDKEGMCHRFPKTKLKSKIDWCGEYQPSNKEKVS